MKIPKRNAYLQLSASCQIIMHDCLLPYKYLSYYMNVFYEELIFLNV